MARHAGRLGLWPWWQAALPVLATLLLLRGAASAEPANEALRQGQCPGAPLRIEYTVDADLAHACEAWLRVASFLVVERGLRVDAPSDLVFADRVDLDVGAWNLRVLGWYDRSRRILRITSAQADWLREPDRVMFRRPVDDGLHISLIVHEMTHAVLLDNFRLAAPGRVGGEYMAYVVQLATMDPDRRARILAAYPEGDFGSLDEITEVAHLMNPHEFGVRAYRHFMRDGQDYILEEILAGRVGIDLPM
ncbi:MAG TPA: DUF6639 family protein [Falsiroseomonas sp.]|jgi:hypothetical protein|nr:DUF6639 family protein [Falsiroseomonas sp.]